MQGSYTYLTLSRSAHITRGAPILGPDPRSTHTPLPPSPPLAAPASVRQRYKDLCVLVHPDKAQHPGASEAFSALTAGGGAAGGKGAMGVRAGAFLALTAGV